MAREFYFAQKAFVVHNDALLVVRKSAHDPDQAGKWEVPGGRMDFGEDIDAHLRREVIEEVGVDVTPGEPFYVWQWRLLRPGPDGDRDIQIVAVARICSCSDARTFHGNRVADDFLADSVWEPLDSLRNLDWIPNMQPVVAAFLAKVQRINRRQPD